MSPLSDLLSRLREKNVRVWEESGQLKFKAPRGALDDVLMGEMKTRRQELLDSLRNARANAPDESLGYSRIQPRKREGDVPLSSAQERIWLLYQLDGKSAAYNMVSANRLRGPLDLDTLQRAFEVIIDRHEILRTTYETREGIPKQVIHAKAKFDLPLTDLSATDESEREAQAVRIATEEFRIPFDLSQAPVLRVRILRLSPTDHVLLISTHHIASDGRSIEILGHEIQSLYSAQNNGGNHGLVQLPIQYADHAIHQHETASSRSCEADLAYWRSKLAGLPDLLEMPTDKPRPRVLGTSGGMISFSVDQAVTARLRKLANDNGATLFMAAISGLSVVLGRYSNQTDFAIGTPVDGRRDPALNQVMGVFINMLVLRQDLSGNPNFSELLDREKETVFESLEHRDYPFEQLVDELSPGRRRDAAPFFQVAVSWLDGERSRLELPGLETEPFSFDYTHAKFDLNFEIADNGNSLSGALFFNTDLFQPETARRITEHFRNLLDAASLQPGARISSLEIMSGEEREMTLYQWNETQASYPDSIPVVRLFEDQVKRSPDAPAASLGGTIMSYEELNRSANQLARHLQSLGAGPETFVSILLDHSFDVLVAILGISKAGSAYVPVDPSFPETRVSFIIEDSGSKIVVSRSDILSRFSSLKAAAPEVIDMDLRPGVALEDSNLERTPEPGDPIYAIYTSGSTGQPKGVVIEQRGLTNYICWAKKTYLDGGVLDFPLFTSLSFDLTVTSIFTPLVTGGRIVIYPEDESGRPSVFQVFSEAEVDIVKLTPSHLSMVKDMKLSSLRIRKLILGGEDLTTDLCRSIHASFESAVDIYNEYGPTEAVVGCMIHRFDPAADTAPSVPIGVPADNCQLYLLDENGALVPPGASGELYVSGDGVARGYLNQPELTDERFVPNPFIHGRRMYRTGDLARWRLDGVMEYRGRTDHQVKVRGVRIELDEIAAQLAQHPSIGDCVVSLVEQKHEIEVEPSKHCARCGMPSNYPGTTFDGEGVCNMCTAFQEHRDKMRNYFRPMSELVELFDRVRGKNPGSYDCIALLSGGKDSSYMLARLADLDLNILALSLDNGFISEEAKDNVRIVCEKLEVDVEFMTTPHMNEIFVDSLNRHCNVCNGCFKTIYTLSTNIAHERGIPYIVTGLSRGQFFETRLSNYYNDTEFEVSRVDEAVLEARKNYHRLDDVVRRTLPTAVFDSDSIFEEVQFLDFYRYCDADLKELMTYLKERVGWKRPQDTGRSTNCLINDLGIYVHKKQRHFHNYALPYSWDVRLGVKDREAAMDELDDDLDLENIRDMMREIGFEEANLDHSVLEPRLAAYYVADSEIPESELHAFLESRVPSAMLPDFFVPLDEMPLTPNGKIDRPALPVPDAIRPKGAEDYVAPTRPIEQRLAAIWSDMLGVQKIGINDHFFRLGGHSLMAARIASRIKEDLEFEIPVSVLFDFVTIKELADEIIRRQSGASGKVSLNAGETKRIPGRIGGDPPLLSFAQERLWFLDQMGTAQALYHIPAAVRLRGELQVDWIRSSLQNAVNRHESLRTVFAKENDVPVQRVIDEQELDFEFEDLRSTPPGLRDRVLESRLQSEATRAFSLESGPLIRARVFRDGDEDFVLLLVMHHIISDGWSMGVLVQECARDYRALHEGRQPVTTRPAIQYADFAAWQRKELSDETLDRLVSFWKKHLEDAPPLLELPLDHVRPAVKRFAGSSVAFEIEAETARRLKELSSQHSGSLFMTLFAAYNILLHRYSGLRDIVVGTPVAGRSRKELESLVGFFVNTLPIRSAIDSTVPFVTFLEQVRKNSLDAFDHQEVPFEKLVEALKPDRDMSTTPVFQVMFALQNMPSDHIDLPEVRSLTMRAPTDTSKFDLSLFVEESGDALLGTIEFDTDLFNTASIRRMASHFKTLLESIVSQPESPIASLSMLPAAEKRLILGRWTDTSTPYPTEQSIHQLFKKEAERRSGHVALVFEDRELTYAELDQLSDRLARHLAGYIANPGDRIGICTERSFEQIIGILAILKSGGSYLPLDPGYPKERLAFMVDDAGPKVMLAHSNTLEKVHDFCQEECEVIRIDQDHPEAAGSGAAEFQRAGPLSPAYVMYTSGSTGVPKGVVVPHRAVIRLVLQTDYIDLLPSDVVAQASNASFDAATFEIWGALLNGGKLVGIDRDVILEPDRFAAALRDAGITTLFLTTALFNQMSREAPGAFRGLRHLLFGGELVDPHCVRSVLRDGPPGRLLHVYGPTENTTFSTWYHVREVADDAATVPIGRGVANTRLYVLDGCGQPTPIGVPGELYLGGDGLALEYLNEPELSAEKFVVNCFEADGARLYRTGDIVRWLPDGNIEFLGRRDNQVKIRGFRIELGEIEAALLGHRDVREAVVLAPANERGELELAAYVVPQPSSAVEVQQLRDELAREMPSYMVPARYLLLDSLPLNANGKLDRDRLPKAQPLLPDDFTPPRSPGEEILCGIWSDVLGLERVGVHDNFFELGGHSLVATQVISRIRESFSTELPLRQLFESPTVAGLADRLDAGGSSSTGETEAIGTAERDGPRPLSFAQERLWFLDQLEPGNPFYNVPSALSMKGRLNIAVLADSIQEIVRRHEVLRTSFPEVNGKPTQLVANFTQVPLPVVDLSELPGEARRTEVNRRIVEELRQPFDLRAGPLIRALLLRLGSDDHVLLSTMHHIVSDGWSQGVLIKELVSLYRAGVAADEPSQPGAIHSPLPELPIQYADFAAWQHKWMSGEVLKNQLNYWMKQLAEAPPVLGLPTDRPRPPAQSFRGSSVKFEVDSTTTAGLRDLSREREATLFMTLLAAWATLLYRYSGQADIVIGSPIANRNRREIEPLIGFFVNTLALRVNLAGNPTLIAVVDQVRQVALDAYTHQDLPFERLVDELKLERDLSLNPLFQVMFALQNMPVTELELPDLEIDAYDAKRVSALFDLVLDFWETGDTLIGVLEFNTDLFDESTIERMVEDFQTLLNSISTDPKGRVDELPLMKIEREQRILSMGEGPRVDYPVSCTINELFEREAAEGGDRVAIVHDGRSATFTELNSRANRIAHRLRRLGFNSHGFVGILEDRGIDFLASMLGVLKAGGAFLPIDPAYPAGRIAHMLADSGVSTVISRNSTASASMLGSATLLDLDSDELTEEPADDPAAVCSPEDVAYILYTSGSTGLPKGAMVRHNGAVNHIFAEFDLLKFHRDSRFLQSAPSSSDISVWQFLAPLLIGGRTVVADYETVCDPRRLLETIRSERVTLIELVPVVMKELLEHVNALPESERTLPDLEWAMVTGEAAPVSLVNQWLATWPDIPLVNAYGPTEAADDIAQHVFERPMPPQSRNVPIGRPLANLTLYVLDRNLQLVPVGVLGEICVSGIAVGAGYWKNEDRTSEAFVANPYAHGRRGDVLYRTGDLGRWLPDGTLECLDRLDQQVKVRGFRIELGEIEGVLLGHQSVRAAAAIVREDRPDDKRLVAYFSPKENSEAVGRHLRQLWNDQINLWQDLHEDSYRETLDYDDPTFNVIGWDSNYTGQPLPREDMHEYVDFTVGRIRELEPRRLLEIGSGTGLIMFPLLPHLQAYVGTDLSAVAIRRLRDLLESDALRQRVPGFDKACLMHRRADDLEWAEPHSFDTVIFPSVVQYFPGIDYLEQVLKSLIDNVIEPGGVIFLGDVRSLPLLKAFHASVQLYKSGDELTVDELAQQVQSQLAREQELAIDPKFFLALAEELPQIEHVEILPKRGRRMNEMTRFRYDVIIRLRSETLQESDGRRAEVPQGVWIDWRQHQPSISEIRHRLAEEQPVVLAYRHVANDRAVAAQKILQWLADAADAGLPPELSSVGRLKAALKGAELVGLEPEDFWDLAGELPYDVNISLAGGRADGSFDVVLTHRDAEPQARITNGEHFSATRGQHANNPLREKLAHGLALELHEFLNDKLPNYMVPSDIVMLDELPLTPAGKIDRKSLPAPDTLSPELDTFVAPRTAEEEVMCRIWADVLGIERVGIADNFFALGGHSLKATQVVSRIHRELSVEIPLREIFSHPTIEALAERTGASGASQFVEIPKAPEAEHYELSHAQRRLWVLSQMEDGLAAYNMPAALLLEGRLDIAALQTALDALVRRHESLRTSFFMIDGKPRQKIRPGIDASIQQLDLTEATDPERRARELAQEDWGRPFDLGESLFRASLLKLDPDRYVLLFNMHHIISDDWSLNVLVREFTELYHDGAKLPPLRIQYRDYARWQNQYLESDQAKIHQDYWHGKLAGEIPVLDLPADFPRPPVKTYNGKTHTFQFDRQLTEALESIGQKRGGSLFMTLVASVTALLHRYTGQQDLVVGFPIAGREHPDLEPQIGFFVNTLPLRSRVHGGMSFDELLEQVKSTCTEAYEHQVYPFDRLVDELDLTRDVSRSPLFDVVVVMQNESPAELTLGEVSVSSFIQEYEGSKFDLHFGFEPRDGRIEASIVYNTELFKAGRIERMSQHLTQLVAAVVNNAAQPVERVDILTDDERQRLLAFNPERQTFDCPETLVEMFESQVARTPGEVAVVLPADERLSFTYAELNLRANQLAHHLRCLGVGRNDLVGLCLDRSLDTVVSILGVLKAGAAYLPFDTAHPVERLQFMLEDTGAEVLVTRQDFAATISSPPRHVVCLDSEAGEISLQPADNPPRQAQPSDSAYVIYTSGSTGRPKGVPVSHHNVTRLFAATEHWFNFSETDVWTLFHSYAFDFSVWELWGALLHGGRLIVLPNSITRSPEAFHELLGREGVTILNQTPSAFRQLVQWEDRVDENRELNLRLVIFGGEALDLPSLQPWFARHGDESPQLVNMYGITETTVHVTYRPITSGEVHETASLIGQPIPDLRIHLLDGQQNPVPIGVAGEICVGGAGVTKGYLNRPELTSQRFTTDPFEDEPGAVLYRSGDLGRYREDGDIEYLGRLDDQIQIRGFRVELGEIAAALMDHPGVRESIVIASEFEGGHRLVAYWVNSPPADSGDSPKPKIPDAGELRQHLRERLPDYMIPAAFIMLDTFPLTPNGKLDRRALPQPNEERPAIATPFTAPRSEIEELVSDVFRELLQLEKVGIDDTFFDLGAHSLMVVEANNHLRETLKRDIPIVWMFQYSTVRSLAERLGQVEEQKPAVFDDARRRAVQQRQARRRRGR